jgi:hypothetical protein
VSALISCGKTRLVGAAGHQRPVAAQRAGRGTGQQRRLGIADGPGLITGLIVARGTP